MSCISTPFIDLEIITICVVCNHKPDATTQPPIIVVCGVGSGHNMPRALWCRTLGR